MKGYGNVYALLLAGMMLLCIIVIIVRDMREHKKRHGTWPTVGQWIGFEEPKPK